jgi:hypothetical protein
MMALSTSSMPAVNANTAPLSITMVPVVVSVPALPVSKMAVGST